MNAFNFLKTVGNKIFKKDSTPDADELKKIIDSHKLGSENVTVTVDGDKVYLHGMVKDQITYEKVVLAAGNNIGVAVVNADDLKVEGSQTQKEQQLQTDESTFYTVKSGDTLWKIAEAEYGKGNGNQFNVIFEANKPMLTSPDKIYPGQVLRIPKLEK